MTTISNMKQILFAFLLVATIEAVPVPKAAPTKEPEKKESFADSLLPAVTYKQYLAEVVKILENDKEFASRVSNISDTVELANQLDFASHSVRTKLDEIKRQEVDRLNALERMLEEKQAAKNDPKKASRIVLRPELLNLDEGTIKRAHLDHSNPHSFETADLQKLIHQVTEDLRQVELAKDEEYKRYEMNKEHARQARLRRIKDLKERDAEEQRMRKAKAQHKKHQRVHKPGSREQLQDTWEQVDHMDKDQFDPRTFFMLHDINGDGHLDIAEIEALFQKELDKVYDKENDTTVDKVERQHEMERMRREIVERVDTNKDMMVSWPEFEKWTTNQEYKRDEGWETAEESDDSRPFNDEEFKKFEEDYRRQHPEEGEAEAPPEGHL